MFSGKLELQQSVDKQNCCHTRCLSGNQTIRPAICSRTWARIGDSLLSETQLADNLLLLVLKFNESAKLSEQFQLEYQEMMHIRQHNYQAIFERLRKFILDPKFAIVTDEPKYILNMASLLVQQAVLQARPVTTRAFFFFQGEPAWKVFLQQEISDYLGSRIELVPVEPAEFAGMTTRNDDFIISNVLWMIPNYQSSIFQCCQLK